jgi:alcohol dehydrogenase YqhD (iron-dependent ADH family)
LIPKTKLLFNGDDGRKPQTEARRYVYRILRTMLDHELQDRDGWMFGGVEREPDVRRLTKAVEAVKKELLRKVAR